MKSLWIATLTACAAPPPPPPPPAPPQVTLDVAAPWAVVEEAPDHVALRLGDTAHGVRVQLGADGWVPGVVPVHDGHPLQVQDGSRWPLVTVAYPDRPLQRVTIDSEGPDLRVRFEGPALDAVSPRDDAPADPVLTWVRLRPRGEDWRVVLDGLGVISLPGGTSADGWTLTGPAGTAALETNAADWSSGTSPSRWWFSTVPALQAVDPYPRTALTLTP